MQCKREEGGKFVNLDKECQEQIVVRFPPEASGFLHIGHAKAALLNQHYQKKYNARLIMRFDDTNPEKENVDYEAAILDDLKVMGVKWDVHSYTSDLFNEMIAFATQMINDGLAYVDDSEREERVASIYRDSSVSENLQKWEEMINATPYGTECCLRAKISFNSPNGCLRDPVIYRVKDTNHPRTLNQFKVYPTYDFACPIVDSIEGVTHAMRTTEYLDRDQQYAWFCKSLKIRKPKILSYSRLNLEYTLLSKRKLTYLVETGVVSDWNDPRFPTVQGMIRRGMTVEGLREFVVAQGFSKSVNTMSWDKIWCFNKKVIDPIVPRYTALDANTVTVILTNFNEIYSNGSFKLETNLHPKDAKMGKREFVCSNQVYVETEDVKELTAGCKATLMNWSNVIIDQIIESDDSPVKITATLTPEDKVFKNSIKLTWLSTDQTLIPIEAIHFGNLLTKPKLEKNEDFKDFISKSSKTTYYFRGEASISNIKKGDSIQILRKGYYKCDEVLPNGTLILFDIPDGKEKNCADSNNKDIKEVNKLREAIKANRVALEKAKVKKDTDVILKKQRKLVDLCKRFSKMTGEDLMSTEDVPKLENLEKAESNNKKNNINKNKIKNVENKKKAKKTTKLGMDVIKSKNFPEWYTQVMTKAELIEYYDISGCYIIRPWAFSIWEFVSSHFDKVIKKMGFSNCYFPIFVSEASLKKEEEHIEDFAPEVAWVTQSGDTPLAQKIAVRPTSETIIYPTYAKWVQSHRDLPIKLNQWCNVVRWEFKDAMPFIRSREFLWQEGHSAYKTKQEAINEMYAIIDEYKNIYEYLFAIPVIKGIKTQHEKFAGGDLTTTVEVIIPETGRGVQAATSHHLGQNFSKIFNISYTDEITGKKIHVYQNSWAITTRSIGILVMVHGDDKGIILPPRLAKYNVVIVPCGLKASLPKEESDAVIDRCRQVSEKLMDGNIPVYLDDRDNYSPGWRFNHWELKGVPLRCEIGPRNVKENTVEFVRRDNGDKVMFKFDEELVTQTRVVLDDIQKALINRDAMLVTCETMDACIQTITDNKIIYSPFCLEPKCEQEIRKLTTIEVDDKSLMGAKSLCIPTEKKKVVSESQKCINPNCSNMAKEYVYFGRSY